MIEPRRPTPISIRNLMKVYDPPGLKAVDNVSFDVKPGEIFGLLGPNGAGKTSIISTMVTLEEPTSGEVEIFGYNVQTHPSEAKSLLGFVPQELVHHGFFDVREILQFHSGYYGRVKNGPRIDFLLHRLGLWEHRHKKVKQLSGGMKRRLLIAKALVHEPRLLLLDEPTAGVDIELRKSLWEFVLELKASGISILLTTHYIQEAEELCDRVGILQKGQLRRIGVTQDLIQEFTQRHIILRLKQPRDFSHPALVESRPVGNETDYVFRISSKKAMGELLNELDLDIRLLSDVRVREGTLEEAMHQVLNAQEAL